MGLGWSDLQYAIPGYGQAKAAKDIYESNALTNKNVPTTFKDRDQIMSLINQGYAPGGITQGRPAQAGAAQLNLGDDPFRAGQMQQVGQLQGIASGQQQGAGELAVQRQAAQGQAAQQALARMQRGGGAGLGYRNAANQSAAIGSNAAGMGQQAALQDQSAAQSALTGALGQGRGGDISVAGQNAGYQQQTGLANAQMQQQQQQANAQNYLALLQQLYGLNASELGYAQAPILQANQNQANLLGGLISSGGQAAGAMMSDERLKTDIGDAGREIDDMLDKLKEKAWTYKDPKHGAGRWTGILAQDMERSAAGKRVVMEVADGKALDVNKAVSTALAAAARLNTRLRALEAR